MIPVVAFFNSQSGAGTTSLVYHLAWLYADRGHRVLAVDLDPQAQLTTAMVDEQRLHELWSIGSKMTIHGALEMQLAGGGQSQRTPREIISANLELLAGDLLLATWEDRLAEQWNRCADQQESGFRTNAALHGVIQRAAKDATADIVLVDLGANLSAVNRAGLLACQHIVIPVAPDLLALQGLRVLGPTVRQWRASWQQSIPRVLSSELGLPDPPMNGAGYVVHRPVVRLDRPPLRPLAWAQPPGAASAAHGESEPATREWMSMIPDVYAKAFCERDPAAEPSVDPRCLGMLRRYSGLVEMAAAARKPIFHLRPADGAMGAHATAVQEARKEFVEVADRVARATWRPL